MEIKLITKTYDSTKEYLKDNFVDNNLLVHLAMVLAIENKLLFRNTDKISTNHQEFLFDNLTVIMIIVEKILKDFDLEKKKIDSTINSINPSIHDDNLFEALESAIESRILFIFSSYWNKNSQEIFEIIKNDKLNGFLPIMIESKNQQGEIINFPSNFNK